MSVRIIHELIAHIAPYLEDFLLFLGVGNEADSQRYTNVRVTMTNNDTDHLYNKEVT